MKATETADFNYENLHKLGGAAAWIVVALTLGEIVGFAFFPQPGTVEAWFALLQNQRLVGLLDFWALEVPMYAAFAVVFLALYVALKKVNPGTTAIALTLALLGIGVFFATNNPFTMLALSRQHAAATTDAERSALLAAGQAVLANTGQRAVGGFNLGLFLVSIAGLIFAAAMRRSDSFGAALANVGLLANALSLADYVRQTLTTSELAALLVVLPNALLLMLWFGLIGRRLTRLGSAEGRAQDPAPHAPS